MTWTVEADFGNGWQRIGYTETVTLSAPSQHASDDELCHTESCHDPHIAMCGAPITNDPDEPYCDGECGKPDCAVCDDLETAEAAVEFCECSCCTDDEECS
jgi:hypothetical protein